MNYRNYVIEMNLVDKGEFVMTFEEFNLIYNQLINVKKVDMVHSFNKIPVPKRKEFLKVLSEKSADEYLDFIDDLRDIAVQEFWTFERELVKQGECTRDWLPEQIESIYNISTKTGAGRLKGGAAVYLDKSGHMVVKSHGSEIAPEVYVAHQMLSVNEYPEYAGNYKNMQALARNNGEHLRAHMGNYQNSTNWYYDYESGDYHRIGG